MDYGYSKKNRLGATEIIIIINVIVFLLTIMNRSLADLGVLYIGDPSDFIQRGRIIQFTIKNGALWQLLTSIFMHGNFAHIFFNMYALYIFGKPLEEKWGKIKYLFYYLGTGILANIASTLFYIYVIKTPVAMIGASGAIFGILIAFGGYYPDITLLLFFIIPLKTKWAIVALAAASLFFQVTGTMGDIAHVTHLFGFIFGYLLLLIFFRFDPIKEMFFRKKEYFRYK